MINEGSVFWFTGLSGSGKTTTARLVAPMLISSGQRVLILDGDEVRAAFNEKLGFDRDSVRENNRRVAALCGQQRRNTDIILVPIISPFAADRAMVRKLLEPGFFEVWFSADLATVMGRDPKGLYAKAKTGEITNMIGYAKTHPYERPVSPDLVVDSGSETPEQSAKHLCGAILSKIGQK
ncbi:MAG: adenylyl-sulfate kinase [Alphaproteobacteria bacterium]|nr:adenylyl-sulfate kinase [Alphaproteobacteria bacterium]